MGTFLDSDGIQYSRLLIGTFGSTFLFASSSYDRSKATSRAIA